MQQTKARPNQLVLATGNKGKVAELQNVLAPLQVEVLPQSQFQVSEADETGLTFIENAIIKARHACEATGLPALADDSGLAVDALQGAPGIYSARYAGKQATDISNIEKLLADLQEVPEHERGAAFHCVLVYMSHAHDPTPIIAHGRWHGRIALQASGQAGFGYDPVFYVPSHACTAAELTPELKFDLSHRGQALRQLLQQLKASA